MSQKNLRKKRLAARAVPVETVQTRLKSSNQKKTSQEQHVTRCKKTYTRKTKSSVEENKEQETEECYKEFYPEKLKRPYQKKEIVLRPKPAYKLVGGLNSINKRKLRRPTKETTQTEPKIVNTEKRTQFSKNVKEIDLICLDDSDSLDDEDLMEILTCESPVWWEDPPNEYYDIEPLSIKVNEKDYVIKMKEQSVKSTTEEHNSQIKDQKLRNNASSINNHKEKDKNFVTRQNKLESLLGNIKNNKINYETFQNMNKESRCSSPETKRQKKTSESLEVIDEDILKTLENIKIPIETLKQEESNDKVKEETQPLKPKEIDTELLPSGTKIPNASNIKPVKGLTIRKCDIKQFKPKLINKKTSNTKEQSEEKSENNGRVYEMMKVLGDVNKETEANQSQNKPQTGNKVSELTVKELNSNLIIKQVKKRNRKKSSKTTSVISKKVTTNNKNNSEKANADDQVTVYKILSEQEVEENKDITVESKSYNAQLNSYYNQSKNINKSKKDVDNKQMRDSDKQGACNNNQTVKSIPVSNDETVKYCLQCSSIFDNDTCMYCAIKTKRDVKQLASNDIKTDAS